MYGLSYGAPKIGSVPRPSTYKKPAPAPPVTNHEGHWNVKAIITNPLDNLAWVTDDTIVDNASSTAAAWMKHPANKMQLPSLQKHHDTDGDGLIDKDEFKTLLADAGAAGADASALFNAMDVDGDGVLTEAEIKALGQDRDNRSKIRTL